MEYWLVFFDKQKTAYELRISDWSSDVCSADLAQAEGMLIVLPLRWPARSQARSHRSTQRRSRTQGWAACIALMRAPEHRHWAGPRSPRIALAPRQGACGCPC